MPETRIVPAEATISLGVAITKRDEDRRLVFGFAKFAESPEARGTLLVDTQGDLVTPDDLEDAAYGYVLVSRDAGEMHETAGAGTLVESFVVTPEKLIQMGLEGDAVPQGWWVGYHVAEVEEGQSDPWDRITSGEYAGFSIEGFGIREEYDEADVAKADVEGVEKCYDDGLTIDAYSDRSLSPDALAERRQFILDMQTQGRITMVERDHLLEMLPEPPEFTAFVAEQRADREASTVLGRVREALGLTSE
jgi:hypothetical protein